MSISMAKKTNLAFGQVILAITFILGVGIFLSLNIYREADFYLAVLYHYLRTACQCTDIVQFMNMHPVIFAEVGVLVSVISIFLIFSIYRFHKLCYSTKKYVNSYLSCTIKRHSWRLGSVIRELDIPNEDVIECESDEVIAFCYGFFQPKICISSTLVKLLDRSELRAVLMHEKQHVKNYEPLKLFIVIYFQNILFIFPGIKKLARKYLTLSELSADERACIKPKNKSKLASAIYKIAQCENCGSAIGPVVVERINRLADDAYMPNFKHLRESMVACSIVFAMVSVIAFSVLSNSSKAYDMHSEGLCVLENNKKLDLMNVFASDQSACEMSSVSHLDSGVCKAE